MSRTKKTPQPDRPYVPYKELFNTPDGEKVLEDLVRRYTGTVHTPGISPTDLACNVGKETVIKFILNEVNKDGS